MKKLIFILPMLFAFVSLQGQGAMFLRGSQPAPEPGAGILDSYPGAAFAAAPDVLIYSNHSVTDNTVGSQTQGQTGPYTVLVRRDNDDALRSFTYTEVSDGTLTTWVGPANNGFVRILYDQSNSGNHATQTNAANQPKIVDAGSLVVENGKAALDFFQDRLSTSSQIVGSNTWTCFCAYKYNTSGSFQSIVNQNPGSVSPGRLEFLGATNSNEQFVFFNNGTSYVGVYSTSLNTNQSYIATSRASANNYFLSLDNLAEEQVITGQTLTPVNTAMNIGALGNSINDFEGSIQAVVLYTTDQGTNLTAIKNILNTTYNNIY